MSAAMSKRASGATARNEGEGASAHVGGDGVYKGQHSGGKREGQGAWASTGGTAHGVQWSGKASQGELGFYFMHGAGWRALMQNQ
jgi:hypothetical protein